MVLLAAKMQWQSGLPDIVFLQGESILNVSMGWLRVQSKHESPGRPARWAIREDRGHGIVEHELEIAKHGVSIDVALFVDAVLNVAQADRS